MNIPHHLMQQFCDNEDWSQQLWWETVPRWWDRDVWTLWAEQMHPDARLKAGTSSPGDCQMHTAFLYFVLCSVQHCRQGRGRNTNFITGFISCQYALRWIMRALRSNCNKSAAVLITTVSKKKKKSDWRSLVLPRLTAADITAPDSGAGAEPRLPLLSSC